jgi:hypothetical protein
MRRNMKCGKTRDIVWITIILVSLTAGGTLCAQTPAGWVRLLGTSGYDGGKGVAVDAGGNCYVTGASYGDLGGNPNAGMGDVFIAKLDASGKTQWVKLLGTSSPEVGNAIALDKNGNSYVTGYTWGDLDGNTKVYDWDIFIAKYDPDGNKQWTKMLGTSGSDIGYGIAADANGNSYTVGTTEGSLDNHINAGEGDIFIAKYDTDGNKLWTTLLGTIFFDGASGIALDSKGNIYISGYTYGDLGGEINAGEQDIVIVKLDANGVIQWTRLLGTSSMDHAFGIATDGSGNCYIAGDTSGDLDGGLNAGAADIVIAKYDMSGNKQWVQLIGGSGMDVGTGIAVDATGNSYISGYTQGDVGGGPNAGGYDIVIAKYDTNGNKQWSQLLGTAGGELGWAIAVDAAGNGCIAGETNGNLGGNTNAGDSDVFVWKFTNSKKNRLPFLPLLID